MDDRLRDVADFYDEPGLRWMPRQTGTHIHPGSEDATTALAARAELYGFPVGGAIVDLATAVGGPARYLARRFAATVLCIDGDRRMHMAARTIASAEGVALRTALLVARTERLPLAAGSCNAAWSQDSLCHMDKPAVVAEVARVLRPGALFAFTDWIARAPLTANEQDTLARLWGFPAVLRVAEYVRLLDAAGFEMLVAEDRTPTVVARPGQPPVDQDVWEQGFAAQYGAAEIARQQAPLQAWRTLVATGRTGFGLFIARRSPIP